MSETAPTPVQGDPIAFAGMLRDMAEESWLAFVVEIGPILDDDLDAVEITAEGSDGRFYAPGPLSPATIRRLLTAETAWRLEGIAMDQGRLLADPATVAPTVDSARLAVWAETVELWAEYTRTDEVGQDFIGVPPEDRARLGRLCVAELSRRGEMLTYLCHYAEQREYLRGLPDADPVAVRS